MLPPTGGKYMAGLVWLLVHACAVVIMFWLDTDCSRAFKQQGWSCLRFLAGMLLVNTAMYFQLWGLASKQMTNKKLWAGGPSPRLQGKAWDSQRMLVGDLEKFDTTEPNVLKCDGLEQPASHHHQIQWCKYCGCEQAIRTRHCHHCRVCVPGFDHHCFFLGACIASSNHGYFWLYLVSQVTLCSYGLHNGLTALRHYSHAAWSKMHAVAITYIVLLLLVFTALAALLVFHSYLIVANRETSEVTQGPMLPYLPKLRVGSRSLFSMGPIRNVYNFVLDKELYDTLVTDEDCWDSNGPSLWDNSFYSCC